MKFRTNFVTNSSSYSSAEIKIDNPVLLEILSKYKEMGAFACEDALGYDQSQCFCVTEEEAGDYFGYNSTSGNKKKKPSENKLAFCYMNPETADIYYAPKSIDEVASLIFDIIDEGDLKDTALFEQCREEVSKRLDEINNSYISVDWHASNDSYGEAAPDEDGKAAD